MKKILTILLILLLSQVCFAGRLQEMQKAVIAAKNGATTGCSTCANGLVQAFILDDGNADLDDWVGDNDLTLGADAADPAFAAANDGLEFDGDDYATFSPLLTDWGGGLTVAILFTIPNAATSYILL